MMLSHLVCVPFILLSLQAMANQIDQGSPAGNILVNPILGKGSHFYLSAAIGEQLVHKGYNVTYLVSNAYEDHVRNSRFGAMFTYEVFQHPVTVQEVRKLFGNLSGLILTSNRMEELAVVRKLSKARRADCEALLADEALFGRLRSVNFSAVLYDSTWICGALIAEKLNVQHYAIAPFPSPCHHTSAQGSSLNPSYVPTAFSGLNNRMSFHERYTNIVQYIVMQVLLPVFLRNDYQPLFKELGVTSEAELLGRTKLWLVNSNFAGEYPCALAPNVISVGGLTTREPNELPSDLEEFVQGSGTDGVIVCSFGTFLIPDQSSLQLMQSFSDAFGQLPQRVIWKLEKEPPFPLPLNVKVVPWIPQNDLLGHSKIKAMFYHGGQNTYYETIFHRVPSVVLPIWGDQVDVASRTVDFGIGMALDKTSVTKESIINALLEVTSNTSYQESVKHLSAAFRDQPLKPAERAAFWISHAINHDTNHLQIPLHDLTFLQASCIDVITLITVCLILIIYGIIKSLVCACHLVRRLAGGKSKVD